MTKNTSLTRYSRRIVKCPYCKSLAVSPMSWALNEDKNEDKIIITLGCKACEGVFVRKYLVTRIEEYILHKTNKNIIILLDLITKLEKKNPDRNVNIDNLKKNALKEMSLKEFEKSADKIYKNGEVFKPKPGFFRRLI